eukprot:m.57986 g.57986  ORF g.57986 m.57986 type:complete len:1129 (-) comp7846_c0_seq2:154-3540(-)
MEDFVLISEFCEVKGPVVLQTIPSGLLSKLSYLDNLALYVLTADTQAGVPQSRGVFRIAEDTQTISSFPQAGLYILSTYFQLCDIFARGYSRSCCISYCTADEEKLLAHSKQMIQSISMVSILLHYSNVKIFNQDLHMKIDNLHLTQLKLASSPSDTDGKTKKIQDEVDSQIGKLVNVTTATDDYLKSKERRKMYERIDKASSRMSRAGSVQRSQISDNKDISGRDRGFSGIQNGTGMNNSLQPNPSLYAFSVQKPFSSGLRDLHGITYHFYDEAMDHLKKIHRHYNRDASVLLFEMDEVHLLDHPSSLLTIGRCVVLNFVCPEAVSLEDEMGLSSSSSRVSTPSSTYRHKSSMKQSPRRATSESTSFAAEVLSEYAHLDNDSFTMDAFDTRYLSRDSPLNSLCLEHEETLSFHTAVGEALDDEDDVYISPVGEGNGRLERQYSSVSNDLRADQQYRGRSFSAVVQEQSNYKKRRSTSRGEQMFALTNGIAPHSTLSYNDEDGVSGNDNDEEESNEEDEDDYYEATNDIDHDDDDVTIDVLSRKNHNDSVVNNFLEMSFDSDSTPVPRLKAQIGGDGKKFNFPPIKVSSQHRVRSNSPTPVPTADSSSTIQNTSNSIALNLQNSKDDNDDAVDALKKRDMYFSFGDTSPISPSSPVLSDCDHASHDNDHHSCVTATTVVANHSHDVVVGDTNAQFLVEPSNVSDADESEGIPSSPMKPGIGSSPSSEHIMTSTPRRKRVGERPMATTPVPFNRDPLHSFSSPPPTHESSNGHLLSTERTNRSVSDLHRRKDGVLDIYSNHGHTKASQSSAAYASVPTTPGRQNHGKLNSKGTWMHERKRHLLHQQAYSVQSAADHVYYPSLVKPGSGVTMFFRDHSECAIHVVASLLRGRCVVIVADDHKEEEVRSLITTLWFFVPGHSHFTQVIPWRSTSPLSLSDLLTFKLAGMPLNMMQRTPTSIRKNISTLFLKDDVTVYRGPKYAGEILHPLFKMNLSRMRFESTVLALFHKVYLELAWIAYIYYHSFVTQNFLHKKRPQASTDAKSPLAFDIQRRREFFDIHHIFGTDVEIVLHLVEVVKQQQLLDKYEKGGKDDNGVGSCISLHLERITRISYTPSSLSKHRHNRSKLIAS